MKLSKKLTTVTPLSKCLAMMLFILFPFVGFYLGMKYQQMTIPLPTPNLSMNPAAWKTYTDLSGMFSLQYPPYWKVTVMHIGDQSDKKDILLTGKEGKIDIIWVRTYGGACSTTYEKLQLKNEIVNVCHQILSDIESWTQISKQFSLPKDPGLGVAIYAQTNAPYTLHRDTLLQIFSTIAFSNNR